MTTHTDKYLTVCENLASGDSIAQACKAGKVAERSFFKALAADNDGPLGQAYARARHYRADKRTSEIEDYVRRATLPRDHAEHLEPNAARLAVDSVKWLASRENQSRYGDRVAVDTAIPSTPRLSRAEALASLQAGTLDVGGLLERWTKPVEAIEVPETEPSTETAAADLSP